MPAKITLIAARARNGVIGRDNQIPWKIPGEQAYFKRMTTGHPIVMGRRTWESIGRPLPGRATVVVTRQTGWAAEGVTVAASVEDALSIARTLDDEVYVMGGTEVFRAALPVADRLLITEVAGEPDGDTYFPEVDWSQWREASREQRDGFAFVDYVRR